MQPLQYDLQCPAAKDNGITHAAAAPGNLAAATTMQYRDIELQNISVPKRKKDDFETLFKRNFEKENHQRQN
jgi:hypothetical protein